MITKIRTYVTPCLCPYDNQGLEELLFDMVEEGECILYLWQNRHTVVIGKNQNAWSECRVAALEESGGHLARRLSGGGAVYHDHGNLNFTFLVRERDYDLTRQLSVITGAAAEFGIKAEITGRNDITVDGRKISGNAFYARGDHRYHHGTILLKVDTEAMGKYLSVPKDKLAAKGVASVKSRVANLCEFCPELTPERMAEALIRSFGRVYGLEPIPLSERDFDGERLTALTARFASDGWRLGENVAVDFLARYRFSWGGVEVGLRVLDGAVRDVVVYSDALDDTLPEPVKEALLGRRLSADDLRDGLRAHAGNEPEGPRRDQLLELAEALGNEEL